MRQSTSRDHFLYAPSQWEATLQCNVVSHGLGAYTEWSLGFHELTTRRGVRFLEISSTLSNKSADRQSDTESLLQSHCACRWPRTIKCQSSHPVNQACSSLIHGCPCPNHHSMSLNKMMGNLKIDENSALSFMCDLFLHADAQKQDMIDKRVRLIMFWKSMGF